MLECSISARLSPLARLPQGQAAADVHRKAGADNRLHAATPITCMSVGVHLLAAVTSLVLQTLCNCLCRFTLTLQLYLAWRLTRPVREERLGAAASTEQQHLAWRMRETLPTPNARRHMSVDALVYRRPACFFVCQCKTLSGSAGPCLHVRRRQATTPRITPTRQALIL